MPPRLSELISGPFYNPGIYPRVARLPPARPFLVLLLFTVLCGAVLTAQWYLVRSGRLAEISDSEIRERMEGSDLPELVNTFLWTPRHNAAASTNQGRSRNDDLA